MATFFLTLPRRRLQGRDARPAQGLPVHTRAGRSEYHCSSIKPNDEPETRRACCAQRSLRRDALRSLKSSWDWEILPRLTSALPTPDQGAHASALPGPSDTDTDATDAARTQPLGSRRRAGMGPRVPAAASPSQSSSAQDTNPPHVGIVFCFYTRLPGRRALLDCRRAYLVGGVVRRGARGARGDSGWWLRRILLDFVARGGFHEPATQLDSDYSVRHTFLGLLCVLLTLFMVHVMYFCFSRNILCRPR
ncbi:hypothetical protein FB451DRAFT_1171057 [Mycena latifolia]|nr:hypothetical protein FB451DRAFT_1171057 [Mycena latifolia]